MRVRSARARARWVVIFFLLLIVLIILGSSSLLTVNVLLHNQPKASIISNSVSTREDESERTSRSRRMGIGIGAPPQGCSRCSLASRFFAARSAAFLRSRSSRSARSASFSRLLRSFFLCR